MKKIIKNTLPILVSLFGAISVVSCANNEAHVVQPADKNIVGISLKEGTLPNEILVGEFDNAGIKLVILYSDNSIEEVDVNTNFIPQKYREYLNKVGRYEITILYRGYETKIVVNMVSEKSYKVNFYAYVNNETYYTLVSSQVIHAGENAIAPEIPLDFYDTTKHYTFKFWSTSYVDVNNDIDVYALYDAVNYYTVNFYNGNEELIDSQKVDENEDAVEPNEALIEMEGYDFIGWDRNYKDVTKNLDVYGIYMKIEETEEEITDDSEITIQLQSGNLYAGEIISLVFTNADGTIIAKSGITIEIIAGNDVAEIKDAAKKTIELKAVGKFTVKATKGQMTGTQEFTVTEAPKEIPDGEMIKITKENVPNLAASITGTKTYPDVASTDTFAVGEDSIDIEWKGGNLGITRNTDTNAPYFNLNCFQAKAEGGVIATTNKIVKITKVVVTYVTSFDTIDRFLDFKVGDAVPTKTQGSKKVTEEKITKDNKEYALNEINVSYDFPEGSEGRLSIERNDKFVIYFNAIYIYGEIVGEYEAPVITEIKTLSAVKTTLDIGDMVEPKFEI